VSSPYIYGWYRCRHACVFHLCHYDHRRADRYQNFLVIGHLAWDPSESRKADTVGIGVLIPIHRRRPNRYCTSQQLLGYRTTRHVLRCGTLSLRLVHGGCVRDLRGGDILVLGHHWYDPRGAGGPSTILYYICWRKPDLFPATLPGTPRHTAPILRLPRRIHNVECC